MKTKGKLIIIGGGEDKGLATAHDDGGGKAHVGRYYENGILRRVIKEAAKNEASRIEILTTASTVPFLSSSW